MKEAVKLRHKLNSRPENKILDLPVSKIKAFEKVKLNLALNIIPINYYIQVSFKVTVKQTKIFTKQTFHELWETSLENIVGKG